MTGRLEITEHLKDYMEKERIHVKCYEDGVVYIDTASQKETAQVISYLRSGNSSEWRYLNSDSNKDGNCWLTIVNFEKVLVR